MNTYSKINIKFRSFSTVGNMLREQENQGSTHTQSWQRLQDCCNEKFKALKEELEGDSRKWKDASCSWIRRIDILKMDIYWA